MSAFILSNTHINVMLRHSAPRYPGDSASYYWNGARHPLNGLADNEEIGQKLVDENYRSVNYRYQTKDQPHRFRWQMLRKRYTPVDVIKACHSYYYQSCETPDWEETEAHAIAHALERRAIYALDGYEDSEAWSVPQDNKAEEHAAGLIRLV